jgi:hypothetical protein
MVDLVTAPTPAGSSLKLGDLNNVAAGVNTAAAGMLLGTTSTGQWGPVTNPADRIGNLLPASVAAAESTTGWGTGRATLVVTPGGGLSGACLTATATATQKSSYLYNNPSNNAATYPVTPGLTYTWQVMLRADRTTAATTVAIYWRRADGTTAASSPGYVISAAIPLSPTWTLHTVTGTAPSTAALATFGVHPTVATGEAYQLEQSGLWFGAGGDWGMPGTPIVNQGVRRTTPNGTDQLIEVWAGGAWVPIRYQSGARTVTGGKAIRDNNKVTWTGTDPAPTGFRDTYATGGKTYLTGDGIPTTLPGTPG